MDVPQNPIGFRRPDGRGGEGEDVQAPLLEEGRGGQRGAEEPAVTPAAGGGAHAERGSDEAHDREPVGEPQALEEGQPVGGGDPGNQG